jgi:hypothetical protein
MLGKILFCFGPTLDIRPNALIETAISFLSDTDDSSLGYRYEQ